MGLHRRWWRPPYEVAQLSIARKTMKLSLEQSDED
jgi:hypothetical protein